MPSFQEHTNLVHMCRSEAVTIQLRIQKARYTNAKIHLQKLQLIPLIAHMSPLSTVKSKKEAKTDPAV